MYKPQRFVHLISLLLGVLFADPVGPSERLTGTSKSVDCAFRVAESSKDTSCSWVKLRLTFAPASRDVDRTKSEIAVTRPRLRTRPSAKTAAPSGSLNSAGQLRGKSERRSEEAGGRGGEEVVRRARCSRRAEIQTYPPSALAEPSLGVCLWYSQRSETEISDPICSQSTNNQVRPNWRKISSSRALNNQRYY